MLVTGKAAQSMPVLYGVRGIGKTSALRFAQTEAAAAGFVTAWASCAKGESLLDSIPFAIRTAMINADVISASKWTTTKFELEFGIPSFKAKITAEDKAAASSWSVGSLESLLRETTNMCLKRGGSNLGSGLILAIDELHAAKQADLAILFNAIQNIMYDSLYGPPLMVMGAGLPSVRGIATISATFGERIEFIPVDLLPDNAVRKALEVPAKERVIDFDSSALDLLVAESANYPYFTQLLGFNTWRAANGPKEITLEDAKAGAEIAKQKIMDMYASRWGATSAGEKRFIEALAELGGSVPVRRKDIAEKLGKDSKALSSVRERLLNKAVITEAVVEEKGYVQFTLPGFADYVKTRLQ